MHFHVFRSPVECIFTSFAVLLKYKKHTGSRELSEIYDMVHRF